MTAWEYFKLCRSTIYALYKIVAAITTSVFAVWIILTSFPQESFWGVAGLFLVSFIPGHVVAASLILMYFSLNYRPLKDLLDFHRKMTVDQIEEFKVMLKEVPIREKYGLPELKMYCTYEKHLFSVAVDRAEKKIMLYAFNDLEGISMGKATTFIDRKYRNELIQFGGNGLIKTVKVKNWKMVLSLDFRECFAELLDVSALEGIPVAMFEEPTGSSILDEHD